MAPGCPAPKNEDLQEAQSDLESREVRETVYTIDLERFHERSGGLLVGSLMHSGGAIVEQDAEKEEPSVKRSPSRIEVSLLWLFAALLFVGVLTHFQTYAGKVDSFGDNGRYLEDANAIRHWDFRGVAVKQFWGLPYLIACVSWLHVSARSSLLLICMVSSLASVLLAWRLWGPWIAAFFAVLNFCWIQVSLLGGSEPLFVALLFSSFWASRKEHWRWASVFAALATLVRPLGFFALLGIGLALIFRRDYRKAFVCTLLAGFIGTIYLLPFWIYFHDPLYQVHQYKQNDWHSESAIGWPFRALVVSFLNNEVPWTNVIFTLGWIAFALIGLCAMSRKGFRQYIQEHHAECIFAFFYLMFLFTYNSVAWARAEFPRFVIPVVPFLLLAFDPWLPRSRYVLYGLGIVSSVLGACSAIGIRNVLPALR